MKKALPYTGLVIETIDPEVELPTYRPKVKFVKPKKEETKCQNPTNPASSTQK